MSDRPSVRGTMVVLIAALLVAGCSLQQGVQDRGDAGGSNPTAAPPLDGTALTGEAIHLAADRGRPVVIDFWASWCGPCTAEQPALNTLARQYSARGVRFVGVDVRDDAAQARAYEQQMQVPYPSLNDKDEAIAANWNVTAPPTIVVVDSAGHPSGRYLGTLVGLSAKLDSLLGG